MPRHHCPPLALWLHLPQFAYHVCVSPSLTPPFLAVVPRPHSPWQSCPDRRPTRRPTCRGAARWCCSSGTSPRLFSSWAPPPAAAPALCGHACLPCLLTLSTIHRFSIATTYDCHSCHALFAHHVSLTALSSLLPSLAKYANATLITVTSATITLTSATDVALFNASHALQGLILTRFSSISVFLIVLPCLFEALVYF